MLLLSVIGLAVNNSMVSKERDAKQQALIDLEDAYQQNKMALERNEANLELSLEALERVYIRAIGDNRLLLPNVDHSVPQALDYIPLTEGEKELLELGISFYEEFAEGNANFADVRLKVALAYQQIGRIRTNMNELEKALAALEKSVHYLELLARDDPDNGLCFKQLGSTYKKLAQLSQNDSEYVQSLRQSLEALTRRVELLPLESESFEDRAEVHEKFYHCLDSEERNAAYSAARADYLRATELVHRKYAIIREFCGFIVWQEPELAAEHLELALKLDESNWKAHHGMANLCRKRNDYQA